MSFKGVLFGLFLVCAVYNYSCGINLQSAYAATLPENTTTAINSGITFTSDTYEVGRGMYAIVVMMSASHDSATDGVKIDQSFDVDCESATSPTFQYTSLFTYSATVGQTYVVRAVGKCFRVRYVNGGTNQTTFDLTTNTLGRN